MEVEAAHLVGTVIRAITRAHAAVVDHLVEPFGSMHRGANRAYLFAGRIFTVLTGHGLEVGARAGQVAFKIGIHAEPLHIAPDAHLLFTYHRDIVLGITTDDAGIAAGATVHVDRHAPGIVLVLPVIKERGVFVGDGMGLALVGKVGVCQELFERCVANDAALVDGLIGFERVVAAAFAAKELRAVILVMALGDCNTPLTVDLSERTSSVERVG